MQIKLIIIAIILTITGVAPLVDFSVFKNLTLFQLPDLALTHWQAAPIKALIPVVIMYIAYTISAMMEALFDKAFGAGDRHDIGHSMISVHIVVEDAVEADALDAQLIVDELLKFPVVC